MKAALGRRPSYREVHLHGKINSKDYRQAFGGYFAFLNEKGELSEQEQAVYEKHYDWLAKLEKEAMTKSYKMVILQYMLDQGPDAWLHSITPEQAAPYFHDFYMARNYRRDTDFSDKSSKALWNYDEKKVAKRIAEMPMSKWVGKDGLTFFEKNNFGISFQVDLADRQILHVMTSEICEYKLEGYFDRKGAK